MGANLRTGHALACISVIRPAAVVTQLFKFSITAIPPFFVYITIINLFRQSFFERRVSFLAKSFQVSFDILGSIDPSLLAAIANAQKSIKSLSGLNGKAIANATKLSAAQSKLNSLSNYKETLRSVQAASQARAAEVLNANRQLAAQNAASRQLADMKTAYKELVKVQTRLKNNAQLQRGGVDLARAGLREAKKSGDISQIKAAQQALIRQQESARRAADEVKRINAAIKQGKAELRAQQNSVKELGNNFANSSAKAQQLQQQLARQQNLLNQLRAAAPNNLGQAEVRLRSEIQATTAALNQELAAIERRNQAFNNFSQRQADMFNAYGNFQNAIQTAQNIMAPFADAADNAMTFEKNMSRLKSLTQMRNIRAGDMATVEREMASMTATIEKLGATTEFTANEIAGAANYFGMSGWSSKMIEAMLPSAVDLASVSKLPIDRVADMLSDDMTAFGIKAGESYTLASGKIVDGAKIVSDAIAYATTQSNMDFSTFHESWKYNAPTAHAMKLSLGESIAQNMMLANAGIKGSMSGTSLRQFWVRMSTQPKAAQKSLEEMGFAANDATQQIMNTQAAMQEAGVDMNSDLFTKIGALRNYYREGLAAGRDMTGWLKGLTGQTALSGIQALFEGDIFDKAAEAAREIDSGWIEGWAGDTAKIMRDNTKTQIDYVTSALDALQRNAGQALLPTIRGAAEMFAPIVQSAAEFVAQNPAIVQACAAIAAAISAATVAVAGFSLAMAGVRFAQAGFATASLIFGDLAAKVATASAALRGLTLANIGAGLSGGLTAAANAARLFGTAMLTASRAALAFVFTPVGAALTAIALAAFYAYQNWDRVAPAISRVADIFNNILPAVDRTKNALSTFADAINLDGISNVVSTLVDGFGSVLVGAIITAAGAIVTALTTVINFVVNLNTLLTDAATSIVNIFKAISEGDLSGIGDALKNAADTLGNDLHNIASDFVSNISDGLAATNAALETYIHPAQVDTAAQIDTAAAQGNIDALGSSAQNAAAQMQGVQNIGLDFQNAGTNIQAVADAAQISTQNFTTAGENAVNAGTQFQTAGDAAAQSVGGLQAMVDGASAVAGALSAKAAEIAAIQINVPQVNYVPMTIGVPSGVAHNAAGGIYPKGAFLTTFAEDSPEAAIPLNKSARAINLWQQAGQMLGVLPENKKQAQSPLSSFNLSTFNLQSEPAQAQPITININVNVAGNADEQSVRRGVEQALPKVRDFAAELKDYLHNQARRSFA